MQVYINFLCLIIVILLVLFCFKYSPPFFDSTVRYDMGQDAKLLFSGNVSFQGPSLIALSPDGHTVAVGSATSIAFWDADAGKEHEVMHDVHAGNWFTCP